MPRCPLPRCLSSSQHLAAAPLRRRLSYALTVPTLRFELSTFNFELSPARIASFSSHPEGSPVAGHSKWANIKHRKERQDKKKGQVWSKCSKAIMAAAPRGGPDTATNLTLRYAIDEAKYANMPKDTIQRAVDKGAGAGQGDNFESVVYEAYGPSGSA